MHYTEHESIALLTDCLATLFPHDVEPLTRLCMLDFPIPLGFKHIDAWLEAMDVSMDGQVLANLRLGYVMLSGYYFLLDAVTDGHLESPTDALYLSHLLTGTLILWQKACTASSPEKLDLLSNCVMSHVSQNAAAVRLETELHQHPLEMADTEDYASCIGRSDSAVLLYDVLCILCDVERNPDLLRVLSDAVYFIQLGDDVADWRKDYRANRWTSFLRAAFITRGCIVTEEEVEQALYFEGLLERRFATMVKGYEGILRKLAESPFRTALLEQWIRHEHDKALTCLMDTVGVKLALSKANPG